MARRDSDSAPRTLRVGPSSGRTDRGVSEVIAFILVFAIIIGSVGILYTVGFQSMGDYQEGEQLRNAERAMSALSENFNDVVRHGAIEERSGELALRDGRVAVDENGTTLEISVNGSLEHTVETGSITYQRGSSVIAMEAGGVFRGVDGEPTQSAVIERPHLVCSPDRETALISVLEIDSEAEARSIAGAGGVELSVVQTDVQTARYTDAGEVNITVSDSAFETGWEAHVLERNGWEDGVCEVDTVTVRIVTVDVEL
ncbi:DUF7289 family protein [Natronobiforma cellulositropha]|uniref:DUF7289 family protein n=1 Tax=Natronobiforma cellulositropha TaxID=1679076 RepID=UPI0021D5DEFD|nr:hypothetical protein [Natronobiforma cellulositropha]